MALCGQVLLRPGMYIGSTAAAQEVVWTLDAESGSMAQTPLAYNPGLVKIFDEVRPWWEHRCEPVPLPLLLPPPLPLPYAQCVQRACVHVCACVCCLACTCVRVYVLVCVRGPTPPRSW